MGTKEIGLSEMTQIMEALNSYREMATWIGQVDRDQETPINVWYKQVLEKYGDQKKYVGQMWYRTWADIDMHIIQQTWGSTACGWEGIGGSAMTSAYTTVIVNKWLEIACVYWSGKLAYIAKIDEKYNNTKLNALPGMSGCGERLTIIYKHKRK